jgi:uncharacterized membrane protein YjjP (DUF1212 family)
MRAVRMSMTEALGVLLRFGILMLRAGDTAFRVREAMGLLANALGIEKLDVQVELNSMIATAQRGDDHVTLTTEVAPLGINAWRIGALDTLARSSQPGLTPARLMADLDAIEATPALRSTFAVALAVGLASGAFSYLNGGDLLGTAAAAAAGGLGQAVRALMFRHRLNQYAVTALCAVFTSGLYCLIIAATGTRFTPGHTAGFIFSVLFLVPGFPLVASLLDLLQHQTVAAMARLSYAIMVLLSAAIGLSAVAAIAHLTVQSASPPPYTIDAATLGLRALASLLGGWGFAVLYNSSMRTVLAVGVMSLLGNDLRLALHDAGMALPPATFLGALLVGLIASAVQTRLHEPRIALTVPSIIIMTPGLFAFQTIVLLNQGQSLPALQAAAACFFIVGAMAMGLAAARFVTQRQWTVER